MNKVFHFESNTIHYKIKGVGRPLILLHGFLENSSIWKHLEEQLADSHQMILIDLPGHGKSREISEFQTISGMAKLVHLICLKEKVIRPIVFGHSMGGYVALELAKLVSVDIVLVHSIFWNDSNERKKDRNRVIKIAETNLELFVKTAIPNLFYKKNLEKCESTIANTIAHALAMGSKTVISVTKAMRDRADNSDIVECNNVAIIQGDNDLVFEKNMVKRRVENLSNKPYYFEIENCGHMGFAEQPFVFFETIKKIIDKFSTLMPNN